MIEETWKTQYKQWKKLKPYQIKLIDDGPKSQSQAWLFNSMWCEWMDMKRKNVSQISTNDISSWTDPWET
tara:strand:+ start:891 stop:1100 length:210 start_codon:yes stop_codon:yes gene_type:complete